MNIFRKLSKESKAVFDYIQKNEAVTKKDLCRITNNNITTLNRIFQPLEESRLVVESGPAESCGGRRPMLYSVNAGDHFVGAVNISSTYYEVAIINFKLEIIVIDSFAISKNDMPDEVIRNIMSTFESQFQKTGIKKQQIHGVGVSVFSSLNHSTGKIGRPINLYLNEKWIGYSLEEELKKIIGLHVVVENITAAAAMLEYFHGIGGNPSKMMYVLCAMNIRSVVINQGKLLSDAMFYEDAFGHSTIDFDGEKCNCGNFGCVNLYATIPAIMDKVKVSIKAGMNTVLEEIDELTIQDICNAAKHKDAVSTQAITFAATMLGIGLSNYINMVWPDIVVISGILANKSELYYRTSIEVAKKRLKNFIREDNITFIRNGHFSAPLIISAGSVMIEELLK